MTAEPLLKVRKAWKRFLERRRLAAELAACSPGELARIASEVGVSEEELCALRSDPEGPTRLLPARLLGLGLDPESLRRSQTPVYRDLQRVCSRCNATERCGRDLAAGKMGGDCLEYCPNAHTLEALLAEKHKSIEPGNRT